MASGKSTRQTRQEKAAAARAAAARAEAQRRSLIVGVAVLAVVAAIVAIFVIVQNARHDALASGGATPTGFDSNNSVTVGSPNAPVTVVAYEDFQCPICRAFEQTNASQLAAWVKAGQVRIQYRPVAILDHNSTDNYSTRALNATAALVTLKPTAFAAYHQALFDNQPEEGGPGLTNQKLIDLAAAAGAPKDAMTTAVDKETYKGWTVRATDTFTKAYNGTPTLIVNGKKVADGAPASVKAAVDAAIAAAKK